MTQVIDTQFGETYEISFHLAANYNAQSVSGAVQVVWNGDVIDTFDTNSANFSDHTFTFEGVGGSGALTFISIDSSDDTASTVNTDGPAFYTLQDKQIGGETVEVKAFAEGQAGIYQVIDGTLQVFDPVDGTYTVLGSEATVTVNAIGFNVQDSLIYGISVDNGFDSLGNSVNKTDLVMLDAAGNGYKIGATPYRSWIGDFDASGNLWAFQSSLDRITMIDVDNVDANGDVATKTFKFPKEMITDHLWDVAFDAASQCFSGVTRPSAEGENATMYIINVSGVADGGMPTFEALDVVGTMIDGVMHAGAPAVTFGAAIHDADGNFYVAGNSGDHDMNDATKSAGGIYRVVTDSQTGSAHLVLVATSPRSSSNDGTSDPRAADPFSEIDLSATVLIRDLDMVVVPDAQDTYDDQIENGSGADQSDGGIGEDTIAGQSGNDTLVGGSGHDDLTGGSGIDLLIGGSGDDVLSGAQARDVLKSGTGDDTLNGGSDKDKLYGGTGHDVIHGDQGSDYINAGQGDDTVYAGEGRDKILSGAGSDEIWGGRGHRLVRVPQFRRDQQH